jgi:hypothetical protein
MHTPLTAAAVDEGRIGFAHLALVARTAQAITDSPTGSSFDESALLEGALVSSVSRFRHLCYHARHAQDPEGFVADEVAAVEAREFFMTSGGDGMVYLRGRFDAEGGAIIRTAVESLALKSGQDDTRLKARREADALVELAGHGMDAGLLPTRGTQRLQRLSCDGSVTSVLFAADSALSDVSRTQRSVRGATRRALNTTYPGCCWPGCDRPGFWTQTHHLRHWSQGGRSNIPNIIPMCLRHHWMVHEGGWQIQHTAQDRFLTIPPAKHVMRQLARGPSTPLLA